MNISILFKCNPIADVLPSKNQALCNVNQCIVIASNDITGMSREQRLITKEHIRTNIILLALYSSILAIKCFKR